MSEVSAQLAPRPLHIIAREISSTWTGHNKPYFGAVPYIEAMHSLVNISDKYGADDGYYIVRYFLANATYWRGEDARRIKAELRAMIDG